MEAFIYKWDPSFINEDIYVSFGTNGTPYANLVTIHNLVTSLVKGILGERE